MKNHKDLKDPSKINIDPQTVWIVKKFLLGWGLFIALCCAKKLSSFF